MATTLEFGTWLDSATPVATSSADPGYAVPLRVEQGAVTDVEPPEAS